MGKAMDAYKAIDDIKRTIPLNALDSVSGGHGEAIHAWLYQAALHELAMGEQVDAPRPIRGGMALEEADPLDIPPMLDRRGSDEGDPD